MADSEELTTIEDVELTINFSLESVKLPLSAIKELTEGSVLDRSLVESLQLNEMFEGVLDMMRDLQQSLIDENPVKATSVMDKDDTLDRIKAASTGILVDYASSHTDAIALCMGLAGVFRKLERTGDHLTNIAEEIVFFIDAKVLKHTSADTGRQSSADGHATGN